MRITIDDAQIRRDVEGLKSSIPEAAQEAGNAALKELAEQLRGRIQDMIPDKGGWYDVYRDSIKVIKISESHFELTTVVTEISPASVSAESSLVWISGSDDVARVLSQHNPWTWDTIPSVKGGLTADLLVRPASPSEVTTFRRSRLNDLTKVKEKVQLHGVPVLPFDATLPKINGKIKADVPFLAKRLEYGLGGFPRTPIWTRISAEGKIVAGREAVLKRGENVFASRWYQKR